MEFGTSKHTDLDIGHLEGAYDHGALY